VRRILKWLGWTLAALVVVALGAYLWAYVLAKGRYEREWTVHAVDFPIPFPLTDEEVGALKAERIAGGAPEKDPLSGVDLKAIALDRAIGRGRHLVESRVGCNACHGADLGGDAVIDEAIVGRWIAPNLTGGRGTVTSGFTASDWDRAVRHGIRRNGRTSSMPAEEFVNLSDRELSDVVAYIRSVPPVDRDLGAVRFGPIFTFLTATDPNLLSAFKIDHAKTHPAEPPAQAASVELGSHIVQVCRGCHGPQLSGGEIAADPNMPVVANLTPHPTGLQGWTETDFLRAMREGLRKDGTAIAPQMPWKSYRQMSDTELNALWAYLQTVPPRDKGNH
jgi:mono/diheme cytochrome c family protein